MLGAGGVNNVTLIGRLTKAPRWWADHRRAGKRYVAGVVEIGARRHDEIPFLLAGQEADLFYRTARLGDMVLLDGALQHTRPGEEGLRIRAASVQVIETAPPAPVRRPWEED